MVNLNQEQFYLKLPTIQAANFLTQLGEITMPRLNDVFLKRARAQSAKEWKTVRGVRFSIASAMNEGYQKGVADDAASEKDDAYYTKLVADHLLLDWENLDDDDGNPIPCTTENKINILTQYAEIAAVIINFASLPSNFVSANYLEEEMGN